MSLLLLLLLRIFIVSHIVYGTGISSQWNIDSDDSEGHWNGNYGMAVCNDLDSGSFVFVGGYTSENQVVSYNIEDRTAVTLESIGRNYVAHAQSYVQILDTLYMIDSTEPMINAYTISTKEFNENCFDTAIPYEVGGFGGETCLTNINDNYLMVSGGGSGSTVNLVSILNIESGNWSPEVPSMIKSRTLHSCITYNDYSYAFGGANFNGEEFDGFFKSVERIYVGDLDNIQQSSWSMMETELSSERAESRAVRSDDGYVFIIGGHGADSSDLKTVDVLDINSELIIPFDDLSYSVRGTAAIYMPLQSTMYAFGGSSSGDNTNQCQSYDMCSGPMAYRRCGCYHDECLCENSNQCHWNKDHNECQRIDYNYCQTFEYNGQTKPCACYNNGHYNQWNQWRCSKVDNCIWEFSYKTYRGVCKPKCCSECDNSRGKSWDKSNSKKWSSDKSSSWDKNHKSNSKKWSSSSWDKSSSSSWDKSSSRRWS